MTDVTYLTGPQVQKRYCVTDMTIWRWLHDPELGFPAPLVIKRRRFWKQADLEQWERARASGKRMVAAE